MKDRCILDNVLLAIEWAKESKQDLVILLLDFEKAYDRINWKFLEAAMRKLGFSETWVKWTSSLYRDAEFTVLVNGRKTKKIPVRRSLRQGCPLAPYLFLFASQVLTHMFNDEKNGVRGLRLPDGSFVRIQCFVDDTALFLQGDPKNLQKAYELLDALCKASGARVNWNKTYGVWASTSPRE